MNEVILSGLGILLALVLDSAASSLERSEYRLPQRS